MNNLDNSEGQQDELYLLEKEPGATQDEIFIFKDKVGYLVGMCGYCGDMARDQASQEHLTRRQNVK